MMTDFAWFALIVFGALALIYALARIFSRRKPRGRYFEAELVRFGIRDQYGDIFSPDAFEISVGKPVQASLIDDSIEAHAEAIRATLREARYKAPDDPDLPHPADEPRWWVIACQGGGYLSVYRMIRPDPDLPLRLSGGLSIGARRWRVFYGPCTHPEALGVIIQMEGIDGYPVRSQPDVE